MKALKLAVDCHVHDNEEAPTLEDARLLEARPKQDEAWLAENREAVAAYNELVSRNGVFSTGLRCF